MKTQLPDDITVKELQKYIWQMNIDRGFNTENPSEKMVLLIEEVGELAKAIRQVIGLKCDDETKRTELSHELADVQIVLLGLASMLDIDMVEAVREKEERNQKRKWK